VDFLVPFFVAPGGFTPRLNATGLAQLAYDKGMYVLTAAQSEQAALEVEKLRHGLLTYALIEDGLKNGRADVNADGQIALNEWLDYTERAVPRMQLAVIENATEKGIHLSFEDTEQTGRGNVATRLQRPRVFAPRDLEEDPLIVTKVPSVPKSR